MTLGTLVIAILVFGLVFWLVQTVIPDPPRRIVQIVLAVVLVIWLVAGFFPGLASHRIP
jgi:hypothetical protein